MSVVDVGTTTLDQPPQYGDRSFFGHPRGLGLLFAVEMWERFSYYGMRALLVLYLINYLKWTDGDAARLYGTYTSLVYLTPLIGGYLADRFIGTRRSMIIGSIVIALGHFALAFQQMQMFYLGLGLIIIGTGFFKPNVSTMVGQLYMQGDVRRDSGFTIFYMGVNLGAMLAPLVCGSLGQRVGWHYGFAAAGVGMVLGLLTFLWGANKYLPGIGLKPTHDPNNAAAVAAESVEKTSLSVMPAIIGAALGAAIAFFSNGGYLGIGMGTVIGAALGASIFGTHGEERRRVIAIVIVAFFVIFFWMCFEQAGTSMNIFADRYTNLNIGSFAIPSSWFQAINPVFIIIFAPVFAMLWNSLNAANREPSTPLKMVLGLVLLGIGFLFLVWGGRLVDGGHKVSPMFLTAAYAFHTFGELCLSPVGLSYVTKVAPQRLAALLMGVWFLANAAANKLGGTLAAMSEHITSQAKFYTIPVGIAFGAAFLLLLLVPLLKSLTRSVKA